MQKKSLILFMIACWILVGGYVYSQSGQEIRWYPGSSFMVEGQAWPGEVTSQFDRLPSRAEKAVPTRVWELSHHSTGEIIRFRTRSKRILVRYQILQNLSMPHMPSTGVSGVDLYAVDRHGKEYWVPGKFKFGDTVQYEFNNIKQLPADVIFQLYLPLYNSLKWIQVGVQESSAIENLSPRKKPIVVYGTSIVQGGCTSRPGLAWPSILGRRLNLPVINLGFSGSGKMEAAVTDLVNEIDARLFILDCMPNLTAVYKFSDSLIEDRYLKAVQKIQMKHPGVPILLAEHSGGSADGYLDTARLKHYSLSSRLLDTIYTRLLQRGFRNIFLIISKDFGFDLNSTVDGLHPNDMGMLKYADAYERLIKVIMNKQL